jgi:hypothetical protein
MRIKEECNTVIQLYRLPVPQTTFMVESTFVVPEVWE